MKIIVCVVLNLLVASCAWAGLVTNNVVYYDGDAVLEGYLAYDDSFLGARPGVLVVHEWMGLNDYAKMRAEMLAKLGYVAFAIDIYGKGVQPKDTAAAAEESSKYKNDRPLLRSRAQAGLSVLKNQTNVDPERIAAIGYCFGGTTVLELARSGAEVKGVVSFHGGLSTPEPQDATNIKAKVLVLHGADDPFVPPSEVLSFEQEMKTANVDFKVVSYPGAVHGFTNLENKGELKGALYNEAADKESWQEMQKFFKVIFL